MDESYEPHWSNNARQEGGNYDPNDASAIYVAGGGRLCFSTARAMSTARQWGNQNFNCQVCKASLPVGTEGPLIISDSTLMFGRRGDAVPKVHVILEVESGPTISELESKIDNYKAMKVTIIFFSENKCGIIDLFGNHAWYH